MFPSLLKPSSPLLLQAPALFYSEPWPSSLASALWVSPSKLWQDPYFSPQRNIDMTSLSLNYFGSERFPDINHWQMTSLETQAHTTVSYNADSPWPPFFLREHYIFLWHHICCWPLLNFPKILLPHSLLRLRTCFCCADNTAQT